jgi:putative chitinase
MKVMQKDSTGKKTTLIGYPCDKTPAGRQWVSEDAVRAAQPLKFFYQNDTYGCMSGSPVFLGDDLDTVYGIHTNGLHGDGPWQKNNAATRITEERLANLSAWLEG